MSSEEKPMSPTDLELAQILWDYHRIDDSPVKSDLILGLGSYDKRVADHAAKLHLNGWAPRIAFTGGEGNFTRGKWPKSEAETFADLAVSSGVPSERIIIEPHAGNTGENVRFTRKLCQDSGLSVRSVILVAKPNMTRRGLATCQLHWPEVKVTCSSPNTHFLTSPAEGRTPGEVVNEIVGDLQRILEYPALGYQAKQSVPTEVRHAFEELVSRGFTDHLIN